MKTNSVLRWKHPVDFLSTTKTHGPVTFDFFKPTSSWNSIQLSSITAHIVCLLSLIRVLEPFVIAIIPNRCGNITRVICIQNNMSQNDKSGTISVRCIDFQFCYREQTVKMPEHCNIRSFSIALKTTVNKEKEWHWWALLKNGFLVYFLTKNVNKTKCCLLKHNLSLCDIQMETMTSELEFLSVDLLLFFRFVCKKRTKEPFWSTSSNNRCGTQGWWYSHS